MVLGQEHLVSVQRIYHIKNHAYHFIPVKQPKINHLCYTTSKRRRQSHTHYSTQEDTVKSVYKYAYSQKPNSNYLLICNLKIQHVLIKYQTIKRKS